MNSSHDADMSGNNLKPDRGAHATQGLEQQILSMTYCNEPDYHVSPHHDLGAHKYPPYLCQEGLLLHTRGKKMFNLTSAGG